MNQKHWGRLFLVIGVLSISLMGAIIRADDWRPKSRSYQIREAREECSVYRSVKTSTKSLLERRLVDLKAIKAATQQHFQDLQACQQKNGILEVDTLEGQAKAADLCSETYDLWLLEGTHLMTLEEEVENLQLEMGSLEGAVSRKCLRTIIANR